MKDTIFNKTNPYFYPNYEDEKYDYKINKFVQNKDCDNYIYWKELFNKKLNKVSNNTYTIIIEKDLPNNYINIIKNILHSRNIKNVNDYNFRIWTTIVTHIEISLY